MQAEADSTAPMGTRLVDGIVAIIVGAMSSFWLDGALATEPAA